MSLLRPLVVLLIAAALGVHGYFYVMTGTLDPCEAAVVRMLQKQRAQGEDVAAGLGALLAEPIRQMLRSEGVSACYRTAFTGEPPEVVIRLDRPQR
jgi:hypothetical protein